MWKFNRFPHELDEQAQREVANARSDSRLRAIGYRGLGETVMVLLGLLLLGAMALGILTRLLV